jgi:hypothetical protein
MATHENNLPRNCRRPPAKEAKWIEKKTDVKTPAAKDVMKLEPGSVSKIALGKWVR